MTAQRQLSSEYATLPAGTRVLYGQVGDAADKMKLLSNCTAVGGIGETGGFIPCTTLIDTAKQYISDLPEGPEKTFVFIDNPKDADFLDFLKLATDKAAIQIVIELPNGRIATSVIALSGWEVNEISSEANATIQISVKGKQNSVVWSTKTKVESKK